MRTRHPFLLLPCWKGPAGSVVATSEKCIKSRVVSQSWRECIPRPILSQSNSRTPFSIFQFDTFRIHPSFSPFPSQFFKQICFKLNAFTTNISLPQILIALIKSTIMAQGVQQHPQSQTENCCTNGKVISTCPECAGSPRKYVITLFVWSSDSSRIICWRQFMQSAQSIPTRRWSSWFLR